MGERKRIKVLVPVAALVAVTVTGLVVYISISRAGTGVETRAFEVSLVIGGEGVEPGKLRHPSGIAVDRLKRTYVVDTLNHRVQVFDAQGNPLMVLGEGEPQNGSLYLPEDVAISPAGSIYVADTGNNRIQFYAPDGKYMGRIPAQQAPQTSFSSPGGIAFDREGNLYVVDTGNNRILKFDPRGRLLQVWGGVGSTKGRFVEPSRIAVDPKGSLWVTDTGNHRVQVLSPRGRYLLHFGKAGGRLGELKSPIGIVLDSEANVYVADSRNARIQKFDRDGQPLALVGRRGKDISEFIYPNGLAMDSEGSLYATDSVTHRIQKLDFKPALMLLEQGWVSYEKKNYEVALSLWKRSLEIDPRLAEAMYAVGMFYLETGRSSTAIEWFKKALTEDPSHNEARKSLNKAYLKKYFMLITLAGIVLALIIAYAVHRQRKVNALRTRARQLREEGKIRETIAAYESLLEFDRNNLEVCKILSELYDSEGMEAQSRKVNRTVARLEPENVVALSHIGKNQLNEGKFSRAAETWKKVMRVSPYNSDAHFFLGVSEAQGISVEGAVDHFLKAFELEQDTPELLVLTARSCIDRGETARAAIKLKLALSATPGNKRVEKMIERLGERYQQELDSMAEQDIKGSLKAALRDWERELEDRLGFDAAKSAFHTARDMAGEALFREAKQEAEGNHPETALPKLERVLELQPQNQHAAELAKELRLSIAFEKGYNCYKEEDYSKAITYFQQVLSIDPDHAEAQKYLRYAHQCLEGGFRTRFKYLDL